MALLLSAFVVWIAINNRLGNYAQAATTASTELQKPIPGIE